MPIYEFRCAACGKQFEELIYRQQEIAELACPKCGAQPVQQQLSAFACGGGSAKAAAAGGGGGCGGGSGGFS